ncbi:MAG: hypothetical protein E7L17_07825 [Clostridium sp.]|uniref:hypothetical protein n=1 Tax=Clostridium sp. TaxID=1506 RepID=UPI00290EEA78|nr:hypothetical protein [Clostridium sp.]MDU7338006.1 hypothetical protein [Clostridium sp.]
MKMRNVGIYEYQERFSDSKQDKLPLSMQLPTATNEALLLRVLLGQIDFKKNSGALTKPRANYLLLPYASTGTITYSAISDIFSNSDNQIDIIENKEIIDKYFTQNRRNHDVHEKVLFEISNYFINQHQSPITAFAHLYRCLEYISYSFPMLYAAKSRNYKGSFQDLKKFFSGDTASELKFFQKFLKVLFDDETTTLSYKFETNLSLSNSLDYLISDCSRVYTRVPYVIENGILEVTFENVLDFFITTRNRFFHMLIGQGQENFSSNNYDISEYFCSINPCMLNWLSIIIQKITIYGFYSSLTDS